MHIKCLRTTLESALKKISCVVDNSKITTKYTNLLIVATNNSITIKGAGLTSYLCTNIEGETILEGVCCISALRLIRAVSGFIGEQLELVQTEQKLCITCATTSIVLDTLNENYYFVEAPNNKEQLIGVLELDCMELVDAFNVCLPFRDTEGLLSGVNIKSINEDLRISCCSSIAACSTLIRGINDGLQFNITLAYKDAAALSTIFDDSILQLEFYSNQVCISNEQNKMIVKTLGGTFPPIEQLIPTQSACKLEINREKFEEAFNLIDIVAETNLATIYYANEICKISYQHDVESTIPISPIDQSHTFKINIRLLRNIFKVAKQNQYVAQFNTVTTPIRIDVDDSTFLISLAAPSPSDI